ncbi:GNAT family N-acetyltransferase [Gemmata sp.]|uniref:GNAT family N-acetyltransferase n=1 Tax=Gemmata sp. TaxID=1914242 RepID=UPI003F6FA9C0
MRQVKYVKRHRMELDLRHPRPPAEVPPGYFWLPWNPQLLDAHARVLAACFAGETDAEVFPCLATLQGCRDLMAAITGRPGFCPAATWLVATPDCPVGTVQGLLDESGYGGVQNLGVVADARGAGLGRALLLRCLEGFAAAGVGRAFLEVTAANAPAVRVYRRLGFRSYKTIYREVAVRPPVPDHVGVGV